MVVFITAATINTGLAIAEKFASEGYDVAVSSQRIEDAERTATYLKEKYSIKSVGYGLQLANVENIKDVFSKIKNDFGQLDVFVAIEGKAESPYAELMTYQGDINNGGHSQYFSNV